MDETESSMHIDEETAATIEEMKQAAHQLHQSVNQSYGEGAPYSKHLFAVLENVERWCLEGLDQKDIVVVAFGALFHDSIEDARQTYNDTVRTAQRWMDEPRAREAAEIVYALTNEKGRTRGERANDRYYAGIRSTPFAPMVKAADPLADMHFSASGARGGQPQDETGLRQRAVPLPGTDCRQKRHRHKAASANGAEGGPRESLKEETPKD